MIMFLLSTQISAQIKTGGGPDSTDVDTNKKRTDPTDKLIEEYTTHLMAKDKKCSTGDRLINDRDLMQVYLKLSLFKNPKSSSLECDEANRYLLCINDEVSRKLAWRIGTVIGIEKHLSIKYKIPTSEADKMVKFFSDLSKKVEVETEE
jgi:hypothetical protein